LIAEAPNGQELTYPDTVGGKGISRSLHIQGLAFDMNLILKDGTLAETIEDYRPLGNYWKTLHPENRWGGDFTHPRPDADHFERNVT